MYTRDIRISTPGETSSEPKDVVVVSHSPGYTARETTVRPVTGREQFQMEKMKAMSGTQEHSAWAGVAREKARMASSLGQSERYV